MRLNPEIVQSLSIYGKEEGKRGEERKRKKNQDRRKAEIEVMKSGIEMKPGKETLACKYKERRLHVIKEKAEKATPTGELSPSQRA